ncbi:RNA polymerase sigma-70 factor [Mucilaginibacter rubeus]|uniref:RNA polymerase sigma-70 factor n=1 Tax=Mucilaginibacter rubeus TaxID=2027860 RepID=A0AAE6JM05_9SPHI|nr:MULTISPECIES: RNA polymerase sigma-70 factor [Mucilaginibacter]QEM07813.1 RNA polymerase sigma-70 factor [Mucilaginibacter rubeus]QEM20265.1 RNA polymerase sigma-70 factor [Mucilaginibacter gossypii]QTE43018.1 RNA polymerase sigma-70 factor [Mucilaginibacter rubeus]QTE49619.1 RNA polymerase sigma-70 factor [Mucilaginibacter rubeus]QTE54714.1 RNA polymerase sigma-70 factor [Mucilaginibacter rubeus]
MADLNLYSDGELLQLLSVDNHPAYLEIYKRYFELIYVHAYKKLRNEDQAKDVTQDIFTYLWFKRERISQVKDLAAYLFTSTRNRIFDLFSHEQVEQKHIDSLVRFYNKNTILPTDHQTRERDFRAYIDKQIAELPPKMRIIFELNHKDQLSYKEIAERLNTSENNVSKQVNKARTILRRKLGPLFYLI